ncbi:flagellar hook-basal body complex protein FliE [Melioribacteraceae bacterium 4301-Me]|uniref:flagellar hook-basal body complex protein FliE n=1 Tax=Pyranulibacter aquaticus TaxID=3163344 RepID=UPI003595B1CE
MKIGELSNSLPLLGQTEKNRTNNKEDFQNLITNLISSVKDSQLEAEKATEKYINGEDIPLHEVMIAGEKAKTNLELLMEIRNKAIDMYKELIRMPI